MYQQDAADEAWLGWSLAADRGVIQTLSLRYTTRHFQSVDRCRRRRRGGLRGHSTAYAPGFRRENLHADECELWVKDGKVDSAHSFNDTRVGCAPARRALAHLIGRTLHMKRALDNDALERTNADASDG